MMTRGCGSNRTCCTGFIVAVPARYDAGTVPVRLRSNFLKNINKAVWYDAGTIAKVPPYRTCVAPF